MLFFANFKSGRVHFNPAPFTQVMAVQRGNRRG
jgi:hypothetical protein